ncbi:MAG: hypothetical protein UT50_C0001G0038 [Candidatus Moranbacteria bacterium GW2011_GWA2_39_41]|nr:MAG: hypothetical protein UT50_C0001G0038 [Candidatus Moranbacteria bacterium GW2011_GWA2_39_41]
MPNLTKEVCILKYGQCRTIYLLRHRTKES